MEVCAAIATCYKNKVCFATAGTFCAGFSCGPASACIAAGTTGVSTTAESAVDRQDGAH